MAQTRLKSGNLHMVGGDNGTSGQVLKSRADGTFEWGDAIDPPTFSSVDYPGDDTALDPAGGQSLVINGTNFNTGVTVTIGGTTPSSITRNSATQLTVTAPAKSAATYTLVITNTDGGSATASNAVSYNGVPAFTNAAGSLGSVDENSTVSLSAAATEPDGGAITYAVTSGSLPSGLSLNTSTGAITGTAPSVPADTTSNFTVTATDNENQSTARAYSITVTNVSPSDQFNIVTYTGNGSTQSITGLGFKPDFVWIKNRDYANGNRLIDSSTGANYYLESNSSSAQQGAGNAGLTSFDNDGFSLGSGAAHNRSGDDFVAWCWKGNGGTTSSNTDGTITSTVQVNQTLGFSIVTYTGNGGGGPIGHGLGAAPDVILVKALNAGHEWQFFSKSTSTATYPTLNGRLALQSSGGGNFDNYTVSVGSSTFEYTGNASGFAYFCASNTNYVAYCFSNTTGFFKEGSYTGNGSSEGPLVETGFKPAFIMFKRPDATGDWRIIDDTRSTSNPRNEVLKANSSEVEETNSTSLQVDFLTNGFQLKSTHSAGNTSGAKYIYMAFAADANTTTPTLADSFNTKIWTGNYSTQTISGYGFKPDLVWIKNRDQGDKHVLFDSIRGATKYISPSTSDGETTDASTLTSFDNDGFTLGNSGLVNASTISNVGWAWKAGGEVPSINTDGTITSITSVNQNGGFSIVRYAGSGANNTVGHGLSSTPEMIIIKTGDGGAGQNWIVGHTGLNYANNESITLDGGAHSTSWNYFNSTAPTSTVFTVGTGANATGNVHSSGRNYMAYCFHSVSGFSKIGSYSGGSTGSSNVITTGFQPDWIIIHIKGATDDWPIIDSVRGDGASSRRLIADLNDAEKAATSIWFPTSTGFYFSGTGTSYNASGQDYIYAAFKIN